MNDIAETIEQLAAGIEHESSVVRIWTVATLASRLGLEVIVSAQTDPAEAIVEVGELWVDKVAETLEDDPSRQADTLRAAHRVLERLLAAVPQQECPGPVVRQ